MNNINEQLSRMKSMMTYGRINENAKPYSTVEYSKCGADGKTYGIIREGAKYYIKVATDSKNLIKENFEYIGGFINRKNNEYSSYANALKNFDLKMMSLKEAYSNGKNIIIESWNPDKNEELVVESTEKMRKEIMRQRQIMGNASLIKEGKGGECKSAPFCEDPKCSGKECDMEGGCCAEKNNVKSEFDVNAESKQKEVNEAAEPLAWHKEGGNTKENIADTYMDTSHGTEVGDDAPFDKPLNSNGNEASNGVVEECDSMVYNDNQNNPKPGTGEVGDDAPFDGEKGKQLDEDIEDLDDDVEEDVADDDYSEDAPMDDVEVGLDTEIDEPTDDGLETYEDLDSDEDIDVDGGNDFEGRLSSIESTLNTILSKLEAMDSASFEDDDLYSDESDDMDNADMEEPMDDDMPMDDAPMGDDEIGDEPIDDEEDANVFESASYRKMRLAEENRLNMFGKHPAYQKHVMTLPKNGEDENAHGRDWNDESVHGEEPFGQKIGSGAPFEVDIDTIKNSIAEALRKMGIIE